MTRAEVVDLLNECERRFPFAENAWIGDVNIWPLIKTTIGEQLVIHSDTNIRSSPQKGQKAHIGALKGGVELLGLKKKVSKAGEVLFISRPEHWVKIHDHWVERFAYPFIEQLKGLGVNSSIVNLTSRPKDGSINSCTEIDLQDIIYFKSLIWWKTKKPSKLPKVILDGIAWVEEKTHSLNNDYLVQMVFLMMFYDSLFTELLTKSKVKTIFIVCFYSAYNMGITRAAARLGISTVDMQHGVQGKNNIAYSHWILPKEGYNTLPNFFLCWDVKDTDLINSWAKGSPHKAFTGGDLWSETLRFDDPKIELKNKLPSVPTGDLTVLFSLQPAKDEIPLNLVNAIKASTNIQWWFREHPLYRKDPNSIRTTLNELGISNKVKLGAVSDLPIPVILSKVDLHITNWSSVVLDAEKVGVPSIIIHPIGKDVFSDMIEEGRAKYYDRAIGLLELIQTTSGRKGKAERSEIDIKDLLSKVIFRPNEK